MRALVLPVCASIAVLGVVAGCGARTGLEVSWTDTGGDTGGGGHAPKPFDCEAQGITFVYLLTVENQLLAFYPPTLEAKPIGTITCPAAAGFRPFSMAVDRTGVGYVVFGDGELFHVSTKDASCSATPFVPGQHGFTTFGMGYSSNADDGGETLYVAQADLGGTKRSLGLGSIDTDSFDLSFVGPFTGAPGKRAELTGTGDDRLFAFFLNGARPGGHIVEVDKSSGAIVSSVPVAAGSSTADFAFAFWGGNFYIFTSPGDGQTTVTEYRPSDHAATVVTTIAGSVVGAGVSTCAPAR